MRKAELSLFLLICSAAFCEQAQLPRSRRDPPPNGVCEAASTKLREAKTDEIVLTLVVDAHGRVLSFTTDSPKGLRLEKMKEQAAAIKAMHFEPAKKEGRPVTVMIKAEFDCSGSAAQITTQHQ